MPKSIENAREQLLEEVRKQLTEQGYTQTTIRSVAKACNIGVGTVYNYFQSKNMLIATVVAQDWSLSIERFKSSKVEGKKETLRQIYNMLITFEEDHKALFTDPEAVKAFSMGYLEKHGLLRDQIAEFVLPLLLDNSNNSDNSQFLSQFIAESLLTWTMKEVPFEKIYEILKKII